MAVPSKQTQRKIKLAARLLIEGEPWRVIAQRIGRGNENTARHIQAEYPELWKTEYAAAREKYLDSVESEALLTQRELMRPTKPARDERGHIRVNPDGTPMQEERAEPIRQSAAHSLLNHCAKQHAQKLQIDGTLGVVDHEKARAVTAQLAAEAEAMLHGGEEPAATEPT